MAMDDASALWLAVSALLLLGGGAAGWLLGRRQRVQAKLLPATTGTPPPAPPVDFGWLATLPDAALVVDTRSRVAAVNPAARTALGTIEIGAPIAFYLRQPQAVEALDLVSLTGEPAECDLQILTPQERNVQLRAAPLASAGGTILVTLRDVTRERLTDRMRVDFVANASHELRTPLAAVIGFIETLKSGAADDIAVRDRFFDIMNREAQRMVRLIDDLLSLSRIQLDKYVAPVTELALAPLLEELRGSFVMRLEDDKRRLDVSVEPELPPVVADRDQILQVLHNLVSNAFKYGRSGTAIAITARRAEDDCVEVCVQDQGDGIPQQHIPRLTERFYRVDGARSRQMGGTGLGLAIVKHIVERHRGRLHIESRVDEGTQVRFTLPVAAQPSSG